MRRFGLASLLFLCAGCAAAPSPDDEAQALAQALAALVRTEYDLRLAAAGQGARPEPDALALARARLDAAALAAGLLPISATTPRATRLLRDRLVRAGYLFLPVAPEPSDPGIALALATEREAGLTRELWGRTVRYRRVVHDGLLVHDWLGHLAIRTGAGRLPPLGRYAGPTVYLDQAAITRRAGQGSFAHLTPTQLRAEVELQQLAWIRCADVPRQALLRTGLTGALQVESSLHERVLLTLLRYGDVRAWRRVTATLAETAPRQEILSAARRVQAALAGADTEADVQAAAAKAYEALERGKP